MSDEPKIEPWMGEIRLGSLDESDNAYILIRGKDITFHKGSIVISLEEFIDMKRKIEQLEWLTFCLTEGAKQ